MSYLVISRLSTVGIILGKADTRHPYAPTATLCPSSRFAAHDVLAAKEHHAYYFRISSDKISPSEALVRPAAKPLISP
jgi:hypothetical protein